MKLVEEALRGGLSAAPAAPGARRRVIVAGGGGVLGSAVLEQLVGTRRFERVTVLCAQPMGVALQGLHTQVVEDLSGAAAPTALQSDTAVVVFDRERGRHGREAALLAPQPGQLPALAAWLQRGGVRCLVVVLPHAPALLPQALKAGLATLDEQAVAALGFEQFAIVRSAGAAAPGSARSWPQRLAQALLSQLHWMVPQREQPVRPQKVAEFALQLAWQLGAAPTATRVAPPELVWLSAQLGAEAVVQAWLAGTELPAARVRPGRY